MTQSTHLVSADITIRIKATGVEEHLTVANIPCVWVWADGTKAATEYWTIADWIAETFGNNLDWFSIKCIISSPVIPTVEMKEVSL